MSEGCAELAICLTIVEDLALGQESGRYNPAPNQLKYYGKQPIHVGIADEEIHDSEPGRADPGIVSYVVGVERFSSLFLAHHLQQMEYRTL